MNKSFFAVAALLAVLAVPSAMGDWCQEGVLKQFSPARRAAHQKYKDAQKQLDAAREQYKDAQKQLDAAREQYEDAQKQFKAKMDECR